MRLWAWPLLWLCAACGGPQPAPLPKPAPFAALSGRYTGTDNGRRVLYTLRIEASGQFTVMTSDGMINVDERLSTGRVVRFDGRAGLVSASIEGGPTREMEIRQDEYGLAWPVWDDGLQVYLNRE